MKTGDFYWCDTGDDRPGFVLLESLDGFVATVLKAGHGDGDDTRKRVHADCLSRKHLRKSKEDNP